MTKLLNALGQTAQGMQEAYGVNRRHIDKFRQDRWGSTSRQELQILMSLGDQCGVQFLTLETDEVWKTFSKGEAASFLSRDSMGIRPEDNAAMGFLLKEGIRLDSPERGEIVAKMKEGNCVVIGSPKYNDSCRVGLEALVDTPGRTEGVEGLSFRFVWNDLSAAESQNPFFARSNAEGEVGIEVLVEDPGSTMPLRKGRQIDLSLNEPNRVFLRASLPSSGTDEYGWDYGIFVMCRRPFHTERNVTTVMLCGLSGFATQEIARELSQGLLFLHPAHVADGRPLWRILCCPWKKEGQSVKAHSSGRRWINPVDGKSVLKAAAESRRPPSGRPTERDDQDGYPR